ILSHGLLLFISKTHTIYNGNYSPSIEDGSDYQSLRVRLTSYGLLEAFLAVQCDPRATTMLHVDSTHNTVNTRYLVFILGISDPSGRYCPMVYYCSSQRRTQDTVWCLAFIKRVLRERFAATFSPNFVMTDASDAQYNANVDQLPTSCILLCWFHVFQNRKDKTQRLPTITRKMVSRDFNTFHLFTSMQEYGTTTIEDNYTVRATPIELLRRLDRCRVAFESRNLRFNSITHISARLRALYNLMDRNGAIVADRIPPVGDLQLARVTSTLWISISRNRSQVVGSDDSESCVTVKKAMDMKQTKDEKILEFHNADRILPFKSPHTLLMLQYGMPAKGWLVNPAGKSCQCRFNFKFGICIHVIKAAQLFGIPCPDASS
ncbi:LOW QUALITY PROTEIN: Hypothetical protein PHPALM_13285, partial [Phytophthora palmivora]